MVKPVPKRSYNARKRIKRAVNMVDLYRATSVAYGSVLAHGPAPSIKDVVRACKEQMALEEGILACELTFFQTVDEMKHDEKVDLVFRFLDTRHRNQIGEKELEAGLSKLRAFTAEQNEYPSAAMLVNIFASRRGGDLTRDDFESVIDGLAASSIDCTFNDMCQLLLKSFLFTATSTSIVEDTVKSISGQARCNVDEAIAEARLVLLFNALDETQSGQVMLRDVVKSLFRMTADIGPLERQSLLMLQDPSFRNLDHELFSEVVINVSEYFAKSNVDAVANEITLAIATQDIGDEEIKHLFVTDHPFNDDSCSTLGTIDSGEVVSGEKSFADSFANYGGFRMPISGTWLDSVKTKGIMHANM